MGRWKFWWMWVGLALLGLLSACGGGSGGGGGGIVLTGTVYGMDGLPRGHVPVGILGRTLQVTRPDGTFTMTDVHPPYTLVLLDPGTPQATVYEGLTRADPKVVLYAQYHLHEEAASGTVTGGVGFPTPAGTLTRANCSGPYGVDDTAFVSSTNGSFSLGNLLQWSGPVALNATLFAWQFTANANGLPVDYTGYGSAPILLRAGTTDGFLSIPMTDPGTMSISGTYTSAPGTNFDNAQLFMDVAPGTSVRLVSDAFANAGSFQLRGPIVPGATYTVVVRTEAVGGVFSISHASGLAPYANGLVMDTAPLYLVTGPPDGLTGVDYTTEFTFSPSVLGLHVLSATTGFGDGPDPSFYVLTTDSTIRIPDLSAYGLGLPPMKGYSWAVEAWGPWSSLDAMAGTGSLWPSGTVGHHTRQAVRSFTTAP